MNKPIAYDAYQQLADKYAELAPGKDYNAHLERPATLWLVDDVNGRSILDAGCGPGIYSEILTGKGARVTGIDISENMLRHAAIRNGDRVRLIKANLEEPLSCLADGEFDGVVSALAVAYVKDLAALFSEFRRVLKPGGWFVFSTEHPFFAYRDFGIVNYFETQPVSCTWQFHGNPIEMHSYYHSIGCLSDALTDNGFVIEKVLEPRPAPAFREQDPAGYEKRLKFPIFIHFKARRAAPER